MEEWSVRRESELARAERRLRGVGGAVATSDGSAASRGGGRKTLASSR